MVKKVDLKLSDEEKNIISFYTENPLLWNSEDPNYKNMVKRSLIKIKLAELIDSKYSDEFLEKTFQYL